MSLGQWRGLWDWSMRYMDGTKPSDFKAEDVDHAKMKWLEQALKEYMIDFAARMKEIKDRLTSDTAAAGARPSGGRGGRDQGDGDGDGMAEGGGGEGGDPDLEEREQLLEELQDIVMSIDYARDLNKIGGYPVLLELLQSPHPSLRWRAAEVVATCVANNPPVQQEFLDGGVLPLLLRLAGPDQPAAVRTKALLALSGLVRHFAPGLQALRAAGGLGVVAACVGAPDPRLARKAMTTLEYMLSQKREDCVAAWQGGAVEQLAAVIGVPTAAAVASASDSAAAAAPPPGEAPVGSGQEDSDLRQAALSCLLQLLSHPMVWRAVCGPWDGTTGGTAAAAAGAHGHMAGAMRVRLHRLRVAHDTLSQEDKESQEEELVLINKLEALLTRGSPPALAPDASDHVSIEQFVAAGREELTLNVNQPAGGPTIAGDASGGSRVDQGSTVAAAAPPPAALGSAGAAPAAQQAASAGSGPGGAAAPLLLGPP